MQQVQWQQAWQELPTQGSARAVEHAVVRGADHAARAFAARCLPANASREVFEDIALPLGLFFLCGDLSASHTQRLRASLGELFPGSGRSAPSSCWITTKLAAWWDEVRARYSASRVSPYLSRLLREDFAAVLETMLAAPGTTWGPQQWERVRARAIGLRAFIELARVLLGIPLPARCSLAHWTRTLDLCALCARLLNDAGSLPRDLANLQAQSEIADPNWILIRAQAQRPTQDPREWALESLSGELEACRRLHNDALAELELTLCALGEGPLRELVLRAIGGHDQATRELSSRYADAGARLRGFERLDTGAAVAH